MEDEILRINLVEFLEKKFLCSGDFAKYAYKCRAQNLVTSNFEYNTNIGKNIQIFSFKEKILDINRYLNYPYFVIAIPNKSYLLYEIINEITIWVCYTEERKRNNGYIKKLLKNLIKRYPDRQITIDTLDDSLLKICRELDIHLFEK